MPESSEQGGLKLPKWFLFGVLPGVVILWLLLSVGPIVFYGFREPADAESIANSLGGASSLFTGLAFAFLIVTIWQQRNELGLQREELKLQRLELAKSIEELKGQKQQMILQNEQNFFFRLLEAYNKSLTSFEDSTYEDDGTPTEILRVVLLKTKKCFEDKVSSGENDMHKIFVDCFYSNFIQTPQILHCFLNLMSFLKNSSEENKLLFARTFLSQISKYERLLFFYANHPEAAAFPKHLVLVSAEIGVWNGLGAQDLPECFHKRLSALQRYSRMKKWPQKMMTLQNQGEAK